MPGTREEKVSLIKERQAEIEKLHDAVVGHMKRWSDLEIALSTLLYEILNLESQIAYVIYFTPEGFDSRLKIVDHTLKQFMVENPACGIIQESWERINKELGISRRIRNGVAHGSTIILGIRNQYYVRHCPPWLRCKPGSKYSSKRIHSRIISYRDHRWVQSTY